MLNIAKEIGLKIKLLRKQKGLTIQELADAICKSKATVSKYETGQITLDISTLYDIASVLSVSVDQLLYHRAAPATPPVGATVPNFFKNQNRFYMYLFDGRNNSVMRSVINVLHVMDASMQTYKTEMFMNVPHLTQYQICENTYTGTMKHYDALTSLTFQNCNTPMEQYSINILASFLDAPVKWGLAFGISTRPLMPIAAKILLAKKPQQETDDFIRRLHVSKEDIRLLKLYNMFSIIG